MRNRVYFSSFNFVILTFRFEIRSFGEMSSLSRELVFLILQFLEEEKFKESVHRFEEEVQLKISKKKKVVSSLLLYFEMIVY